MISLSTVHLPLAVEGKSFAYFMRPELMQQRYCAMVRDVQDLSTPEVESLQNGQSSRRRPSLS